MLEENKRLYEEAEIIVVGGNTNGTARWKLDERSQAQRRYLDVLDAGCPVCGGAIKSTSDGSFSCGNCQKPVSFSLTKLNSREIEVDLSGIDRNRFLENQSVEPETHIVFCQIDDESKLILQVTMKCLSCQKPMRKRALILELLSGTSVREVVYCSENCGIRTFLRTGTDGQRIYIAPYIERIDEPFNDPFEINVVDRPLTDLLSAENVEENVGMLSPVEDPIESDNTPQPRRNPPHLHVDYKHQILELLQQENRPMTRKKIYVALVGYSPTRKRKNNRIDNALRELVDKRSIAKIGHGTYVICR